MAERKSLKEIELICKNFIESKKTIGEFCKDNNFNSSSICSWMESRGYRMAKKEDITKYRKLYLEMIMKHEPELLDGII